MSKISVITTSIRPMGLEIVRESLLKQEFKDFEWLVDINWNGKHDLNAAYNRCIRRAKGELIVSWQDFIKAPSGTLQRFWNEYQGDTKTFYTCPVGKTNNWVDVKYDWRETRQSSDISYDHCEFDMGAFPTKAMYEIGGFDEELDTLWSMDNISVCKRAEMKGYKFKNLKDLKTIALDHDAVMEHPFRKDYKPALSNLVMEGYVDNPVLPYLTLIDNSK